jgi:hypothetical protein
MATDPKEIPSSDVGVLTAATNGSTEPAEPMLPSLARRAPLIMEEIVLPVELVQIFSKKYEMLSLEHLGPSRQQKVLLHWGEVQEIRNRIRDDPKAATDSDDRDLDFAYDSIFAVIVPKLPAHAKAKLTPDQKQRLFLHFLDYQNEVNLQTGKVTATEASALRSTGDSPSQT